MRKTLTLVAVVMTAGSLAACKPFWEKEPPPAPVATATDPATPADPTKPADQMASNPTGAPTPDTKAETPATPAAKK